MSNRICSTEIGVKNERSKSNEFYTVILTINDRSAVFLDILLSK